MTPSSTQLFCSTSSINTSNLTIMTWTSVTMEVMLCLIIMGVILFLVRRRLVVFYHSNGYREGEPTGITFKNGPPAPLKCPCFRDVEAGSPANKPRRAVGGWEMGIRAGHSAALCSRGSLHSQHQVTVFYFRNDPTWVPRGAEGGTVGNTEVGVWTGHFTSLPCRRGLHSQPFVGFIASVLAQGGRIAVYILIITYITIHPK